MSQEIKVPLDFKMIGKIINLPDGVDPQDAATVHQLDAAIASGSRNIDGGFAAETYLTIQNFDGGGA